MFKCCKTVFYAIIFSNLILEKVSIVEATFDSDNELLNAAKPFLKYKIEDKHKEKHNESSKNTMQKLNNIRQLNPMIIREYIKQMDKIRKSESTTHGNVLNRINPLIVKQIFDQQKMDKIRKSESTTHENVLNRINPLIVKQIFDQQKKKVKTPTPDIPDYKKTFTSLDLEDYLRELEKEVNAVAKGSPPPSNVWADDTYEIFTEILKQIDADERFKKHDIQSQDKDTKSLKPESSRKIQRSKSYTTSGRDLKKDYAKGTTSTEPIEISDSGSDRDSIGSLSRTFRALSLDAVGKKRRGTNDRQSYINNFGLTLEELNRCAQPKAWFSTEVIETYLAMSIAKSQESVTMSFVPSHAFYIQFIHQNRNIDTTWARQIDLKLLDGIFILLNLNGNHWALGLLNLRTNSFEIYDSLNHGVDIEQNIHKKQFVESVLSYFEALYHFKGEKYEKPILRENIKIPQQNNGYDCGVFTLMYAKNIMEKKSKFEVENFSNIAVDNFRQQIINDIQREQFSGSQDRTEILQERHDSMEKSFDRKNQRERRRSRSRSQEKNNEKIRNRSSSISLNNEGTRNDKRKGRTSAERNRPSESLLERERSRSREDSQLAIKRSRVRSRHRSNSRERSHSRERSQMLRGSRSNERSRSTKRSNSRGRSNSSDESQKSVSRGIRSNERSRTRNRSNSRGRSNSRDRSQKSVSRGRSNEKCRLSNRSNSRGRSRSKEYMIKNKIIEGRTSRSNRVGEVPVKIKTISPTIGYKGLPDRIYPGDPKGIITKLPQMKDGEFSELANHAEHPFRDNLYIHDRKRGDSNYWRCRKRKDDCHGRINTIKDKHFRTTALHTCKEMDKNTEKISGIRGSISVIPVVNPESKYFVKIICADIYGLSLTVWAKHMQGNQIDYVFDKKYCNKTNEVFYFELSQGPLKVTKRFVVKREDLNGAFELDMTKERNEKKATGLDRQKKRQPDMDKKSKENPSFYILES